MSRRLASAVTVDIDASSPASVADPHGLARSVDRTLTTSVRLGPGAGVGAVTRLRHLDLEQLAALEVSGAPMKLRNDLCTPGAVFIFTLVAGDCSIRCDSGEVRLASGQFTVLRGDRTVHASHASAFHVRGTRLPAAQLERELADWAQAELQPIDATNGAGRLVFRLQDVLLDAGTALSNRSADAFAQTLASVLADALRNVVASRPDDGIRSRAEHHKRRIRGHVRERLADPLLDVGSVAASVGLSIGHVHRLFADEPLSLAAWIQAERLDVCRTALLEGRSAGSLTELALSWGFRDPAHFSRSFKRRFGMSPSALLRKGRAAPVSSAS